MSATTSPSSHVDRGRNRPPRHNKWREKGEEDTLALALPAGVAQCARCVLARCARLIPPPPSINSPSDPLPVDRCLRRRRWSPDARALGTHRNLRNP
eukprot:scaffold5696_cov119-Isochrysis_galbana.AAC.14